MDEGEIRRLERLKTTDLHLRTAIEQSPLGTAILGPDGRHLLVNSAWNSLLALGEGGSLEGSTSCHVMTAPYSWSRRSASPK